MLSSGASIVFMIDRSFLRALVDSSEVTRLRVVTTSDAFSGVPSEKVTPDCRWKVYVVPSGDTSHDFASSGSTLPSSVSTVRPSTTLRSSTWA